VLAGKLVKFFYWFCLNYAQNMPTEVARTNLISDKI
jgi:hypothetical protein